jgi:ribonuclease HI
MHCDGAWGESGAGIVATLTPPNGPKLRYTAQLQFLTTYNITKYEAVLLVLRKLRALGVGRSIIKSNLQVVVGHIEMTFMAKEPELVKYLAIVRRIEKHFTRFSLRHIPRAENIEADELAKVAAQNLTLPLDVFIQTLTIKAIKEEEVHPTTLHVISSKDWRSPIFAF